MRRLLLLLALLLLTVPALAFRLGTTVSSSNCPNGTAYADGCPGAPAWSSVKNPGFFTGVGGTAAAQSGQPAYATRPPWNVSGVDYAIGAAAPASLADPATASLPSGCTYHAGGGNNVSYIICSVAGNVTLSGLNLSAINGHNCTMIDVWASSVSGTFTISNNYSQWNSTNCGYQTFCAHPACSTNGGGGNVPAGDVYITGNTIDWTDVVQGNGSDSNPSIDAEITHNIYVQYNYVLNTQCRFFSIGPPQGGAAGTSAAGTYLFRFNYFWQQDYECDGSHVELGNISSSGDTSGNASLTAWNTDFNTIQIAKNMGKAWAAVDGDVFQPGNYATISSETHNNNTIVTNTSVNTTINRLIWTGAAQKGSLSISGNYLDNYNGGTFLSCQNGPNHHNSSDHTGTGGTILPWTTSYPVIKGNVDLVTGNTLLQNQIVSLSSCQPYGVNLVTASGAYAAVTSPAAPSVSITYSPTAGNLVCATVLINSGGSGSSLVSVTDNQSDTYTIQTHKAGYSGAANSGNYWTYMACKIGVASGVTTITANFDSSYTYSAIYIDEVSGATGIDGGAAATTTLAGAGAISSGAWTTTQGELVLGYVHSQGANLGGVTGWSTSPGVGSSNDNKVYAYLSPQSVYVPDTATGASSNLAIGVAVY